MEEYSPEQSAYLKRLEGQKEVGGDTYDTQEAAAMENYTPTETREYVNPQQDYQMQSGEFGTEDYGESYIDDYLGMAASPDDGGYYSDDFAGDDTGGWGGGHESVDQTKGYDTSQLQKGIDAHYGYGDISLGSFKDAAMKGVLSGGYISSLGAPASTAIKMGLASGITGSIPGLMSNVVQSLTKRQAAVQDLMPGLEAMGISPDDPMAQDYAKHTLGRRKDRGFFSSAADLITGHRSFDPTKPSATEVAGTTMQGLDTGKAPVNVDQEMIDFDAELAGGMYDGNMYGGGGENYGDDSGGFAGGLGDYGGGGGFGEGDYM